MRFFDHKYVFFFGLALNSLVIGLIVLYAWNLTGGFYVYPLDDAYIHMAIAKNFAQHGVWGISEYHFSSTTSSPLYTLILAGLFKLFGNQDWLPLLFNVFLSALLLWQLYALARKSFTPLTHLALSLALFLFIPLPHVAILGMEHVFHSVAIFALFIRTRSLLQNPGEIRPRDFAAYCLLAAISTMIRYESLFVVGAITLVLFYQKRWKQAVLLGISAFAFVGIYGWISLANGSLFLPNSLLVKGTFPGFSLQTILQLVWFFKNKLLYSPSFYIMLVLLSLVFLSLQGQNNRKVDKMMVAIAAISLACHTTFASGGSIFWFLRYESYLTVMAFLAVAFLESWLAPLWKNHHRAFRQALVAFLLVVSIPFWEKTIRGYGKIPIAIKNIHDQQYHMALFLHQYFPNSAVAANDIGAISYFTHIDLFDLMGLGSVEVIKGHDLPKKQLFAQETQEKETQIALLYTGWFEGNIPDAWETVGTWTLPDNYVCGDSVVTFFAVDPNYVDSLSQALQNFTPQLPAGVKVWIEEIDR